MSKKKSPQKGAAAPVAQGNVFATFVREAQMLGNEVAARRAFADELTVYLTEKNLIAEFEAWRKAR